MNQKLIETQHRFKSGLQSVQEQLESMNDSEHLNAVLEQVKDLNQLAGEIWQICITCKNLK